MKIKQVINNDYLSLTGFISDLKANFRNGGKVLHDQRNKVSVFEVGDQKIVVKRFKRPNLLNRFAYTLLRGSKAKRGYYNALRVLSLGINTPGPIAYVDIFGKYLIGTSFLVTEYTNYIPIGELVVGSRRGDMALIHAFAQFTARLHELGIQHDDYNPWNVLFKEMEDGSYDFTLIDINRMHFGPMSRQDCISNIIRVCAEPEFTRLLAKEYAIVRGWDIDQTVNDFVTCRTEFNINREKKGRIKKYLRSLKGYFK